MIEINILDFIPQEIRQQAQDTLVDFVSEQAKKFVSDGVADKLKQLRSDGSFRKQFDKGLDKALKRFTDEYYEKDEDLVDAIVQEKDLFKSPDVKDALITMLKSPGSYLADEGDVVAQTFDSVLPGRKNRERVNKAMMYLLRCLVKELWHLPELQPVYSLQFQKITAEAMKQQVELQKVQLQALVGVNEGVRQALLQLTEAIGEKKLLSSGNLTEEASIKQILHNLPQPDYGVFIGRGKEMEQIIKVLKPYPESQHSVVTIDGIGGIGKSALALEVAYYYLRNYAILPPEERFGAIIWTSAKLRVLLAEGIKIRPQALKTLDDIYFSIAITLEKNDITKVKAEKQTEVVKKALSSQRTLLIVDNLETVDDETVLSFLKELPAPTKAIVTTRHRINVAFDLRLTGMPINDAIALINKECEKKGVDLTDTEKDLLYRRVGGIPLAIVWSVSQMGRGYSVKSVLRRLGDATGDIARFCFDGSAELIYQKSAYPLILGMSLFSSNASRDALGFISDLSTLDRDDGLADLEVLSLADKSRDRYSLLPLTKNFISAELEKFPQKKDLFNRWIQWLEKWAVTYGFDLDLHIKDKDMIELEYENLMDCLEWCYRNKKWENYLRIADGLFDFMLIGNLFGPLSQIMERINELLLTTGLETPRRYFILGYYYWYQGDYSHSSPFFEKAKKISEQENDQFSLARVLDCQAHLLTMNGNIDEAECLTKKILKISNDLNDKYLIFLGSYRMAHVLEEKGNAFEGSEWLSHAKRITQDEKWDRLLAWINYYQGKLAIRQGDIFNAKKAFEHSMQQAELIKELSLVKMCDARLRNI